ncbi:MAG: LysR substrate-binding domain-containing protein [Leptolyngbyaceae cyanobacterium]
MQDIEEARLCIAKQQDIPHGVLRVGLLVVFGQLHSTPLLTDFLERYPGVKLELQLSEVAPDS